MPNRHLQVQNGVQVCSCNKARRQKNLCNLCDFNALISGRSGDFREITGQLDFNLGPIDPEIGMKRQKTRGQWITVNPLASIFYGRGDWTAIELFWEGVDGLDGVVLKDSATCGQLLQHS